MRRHLAVTALAILVVLSAPAHGSELLLWLLEQYLEALRQNAGIPGLALAVVGEDRLLWERGLGFANLEAALPTRPDTPFHVDGLTQVVTATLTLRCVEEGRLDLDDRVGRFVPVNPDADSTIRHVLTHTRPSTTGLTFAYQHDRYAPLAAAVAACTGQRYRDVVAAWFDRLGMIDSVPGPDAAQPDEADGPDETARRARYRSVLEGLAVPYHVDRKDRPLRSEYAATTLTGFGGIVSTVRDLARFDLALKKGALLRPETVTAAWQNPVDAAGVSLPHGMGWFVQAYRGELVVWQFGVAERASSSLMVTVPRRGLTFIALANSDGLVKPFPLASGDLLGSPVGRVFLELFVR